MRTASDKGLVSATTEEMRWAAEVPYASEASEELKRTLKKEWGDCTPEQACSILSSDDIGVTNQGDKTLMLQKLRELDELVRQARRARALPKLPALRLLQGVPSDYSVPPATGARSVGGHLNSVAPSPPSPLWGSRARPVRVDVPGYVQGVLGVTSTSSGRLRDASSSRARSRAGERDGTAKAGCAPAACATGAGSTGTAIAGSSIGGPRPSHEWKRTTSTVSTAI